MTTPPADGPDTADTDTADTDTAYADTAAFTRLPRTVGLALSPDGRRLVATVQAPDRAAARWVPALWEVPLDGGEPVRLTRSEQGESAPAFLPDGSLLFVSARPDPDAEDADGRRDDAALWLLPPAGEPRVLARCPGGLSSPVVAAAAGTVVAGAARLAGTPEDGDDAARRATREERGATAIWHTGVPVRHWDHELDVEQPRLVAVDPGGRLRDLAPDAGRALTEGEWSISADGSAVATTWRTARRGGGFPYGVALIDVATGERTVLAEDEHVHHSGPRISPDGTRVALLREDDGDFATPATWRLRVVPVDGGTVDGGTVDGGTGADVDLGDLHPAEWVWSADGGTLYVTGDWHGRGAVLAADPATGAVRRRLACDAVYTDLCPAPDGTALYALRSTVDAPPAPVRLDPAAVDQTPAALPDPAPVPAPPGRLTEVETEVDGAVVRGWLCLPEGEGPAPLMLWVHGGPFTSSDTWSWRWNPWVAVARGWAVLLPDPALSTGYGPDWIARAWPHRARLVWRDLEGLLDAALARDDLDATRTACLGASFGGYMTNWIAGHTTRFGAIVTHAGLWALDQQHDTTDDAHWKNTLFGEPEEHPEWYAENSPHHTVRDIRTPLLVVHGNRDHRVPVSEALRLWWDLNRHFDGDPGQLPHRFLQFTGQGHWITSPADAEVWYESLLGFCAHHVLGEPERRPELL